jgi:hypothetical protein
MVGLVKGRKGKGEVWFMVLLVWLLGKVLIVLLKWALQRPQPISSAFWVTLPAKPCQGYS